MIQTAYWYLHTDQFRYDPFGADTLAAGRPAAGSPADDHRRRDRAVGPDGLDAVLPDLRPQPARRSPTRPTAAGRAGRRLRRRRAARPAGCASPARTRTRRRTSRGCSPSGGPTCSARRPRATSTSSGTCSAPTPSVRADRGAAARPARATWCGATSAPSGKLDLLLTLDFRMTSTTVFSDVVLPAATWYEKHDLNTTDMHPFVHSFNPAIAPPWQTRTDWDAFHDHRRGVQPAGRDAPGRPHATWSPRRCCTTPRTRWPTRTGGCADWKAGECEPVPGRDDAEAGRGRARLRRGRRRRWPRSARCSTRLGATTKGVTFQRRTSEVEYLRHKNGTVRGGVGRRPPVARPRRRRRARRSSPCPAPPTGTSPPRASDTLEERTGMQLADLAAEHEGKQITFADTQSPADAGHHLAGVVGLGVRRAPLLAVHHQRRAAQALAHAHRPAALLPRPRLDGRARRAAAGLPAAAEHARAVRRAATSASTAASSGIDGAVPDPAQQVVDPLRVPGQPVHAVAVPRRPDDLDEQAGRREDRRRTTTTGSRRSTATASSSPARSCRTGCPRAPSTCTTRRTGSSTCRAPRPPASAAASTTR